MLKNRIAEQKIILDQLLLLYSFYEKSLDFEGLISGLNELQEIYSHVNITHEYQESNVVEQDGLLLLIDNPQSQLNITNQHIEEIRSVIARIRKNIT